MLLTVRLILTALLLLLLSLPLTPQIASTHVLASRPQLRGTQVTPRLLPAPWNSFRCSGSSADALMPPELQATWAFDNPAGPPCTSMLHTAPAAAGAGAGAAALLLLALAGSQHTVQTIQTHTTSSIAVLARIVKTPITRSVFHLQRAPDTTCIRLAVPRSKVSSASVLNAALARSEITTVAASALVG